MRGRRATSRPRRRKASGCCFLDDDNVLFPDAVSRLVRAARFCGADAVSAAAVRFTGNGDPRTDTAAHGNQIRYLGAARAWNRFRNVAGDTCALVRREAFAAVGGFPEDYGLWLQDMCLFNRLLQAGYRTEPMPDPVFYYRHSPGSGSGVAKRLDPTADAAAVRLLSPYLAGLPDEERAFAAYTISATPPGGPPGAREGARSGPARRGRSRAAAGGTRPAVGRTRQAIG